MSSQRNVTNVMAQGSRNNRARARMAHGMRSTRVYRLVAVAMPIVWPLYTTCFTKLGYFISILNGASLRERLPPKIYRAPARPPEI